MGCDLTKPLVRELLDYNPDDGHLTWKVRDRKWFKRDSDHKTWNRKHAGKRAGSLGITCRGYKYREMTLLGKKRKEHHVVWIWLYDNPLPEQIDHYNQDATDNSRKNLRASNDQHNRRNLPKYRTNTSGVTGVRKHRSAGRWIATCRVNGKEKRLGTFDSIEEAALVVQDYRISMGFSPNHGI